MEIRQLQLFVALAEEKSFTRAAKRMHIVQSGLSNSLKDLEEELGVQLCRRTTRNVTLTVAGDMFLTHARVTLSAFEEARRSVEPLNGDVRGRLCVGILECCSPYVAIADVLARFRNTFPQVKIQLRSLDGNQVVDCVRSGEVDVSFYAMMGRSIPKGLRCLPYCEDSLLAVCSVDHKLAALRTVSVERLSRETFVDTSREKALRWLIDQHFRKAGLKREAAFEVDNPRLGIDLIEKNLGVGIMQAAVAEQFASSRQVRLLALSGPKSRLPRWRLGLLWKQNRRVRPETDPVDHFLRMVSPDYAQR
jgi:DNA-binding transcriptional LysR family regulator